jgi:hypothetical protein
MGFWAKFGRGASAIVTVGGSERIRFTVRRYETARAEYDKNVEKAKALSAQLTSLLRALGKRTEDAFHQLAKAERIMSPLQKLVHPANVRISVDAQESILATASKCSIAVRDFTTVKGAAGGTIAGMTIGLGSWTAVSLLGSASTGVAIGSLHGIAATNAALAWFGGGSLATGGLGMAGGTFVLGGLVLLPMIGISAWMSHRKANKISRIVQEVEEANEKNVQVIRRLSEQRLKVVTLMPNFSNSVETLAYAVTRAQKLLFPYGWLSKLSRRLRSYFHGYYYRPSEMKAIEELAGCIDSFLDQFSAQKKLLSQSAGN